MQRKLGESQRGSAEVQEGSEGGCEAFTGDFRKKKTSSMSLGSGLKKVIPTRIKVSENFYLDELVDPHTYLLSEDNGRSKMPDVLPSLQLLRELKGSPIYVNNWWGTYVKMHLEGFGNFEIIEFIENSKLHKWSGYRPEHCPIGAKASAHKESKAVDPKGDEVELFNMVKDNANKFYKAGLKRLENPEITKGWLHMDSEERNGKDGFIRVINRRSHAFDIDARIK
jgi:hypothetical protein